MQASQHYAQPPHLFWNCGATDATEFRMVSAEKTGPDFAAPLVGRGTATADLDGDGDLDLVITANRGRPRVLKNEQTLGHAFVRCRLVDTVGPREAIGAWVELTHNGVTQRRQVMPTRGYLSQSELVVTFGLGQPSKTGEDSVEVRIVWPDGTAETRAGVPVNRLTTIERAGTVK